MNPLDQDRPMPFSVTCCSRCRSPVHLREVVDQFNVATAQRYQPQGYTTFCATFVEDVMNALGVIWPAVWGENGKVGSPLGPPPNQGGYRRLRANDHQDWASGLDGDAFGWKEVDAQTAIQRASCGFPTVASYKNQDPNKDGHEAVVLPADPQQPGKTIIAQAGARCFNGEPLENGFGTSRIIIPVRFFTHD